LYIALTQLIPLRRDLAIANSFSASFSFSISKIPHIVYQKKYNHHHPVCSCAWTALTCRQHSQSPNTNHKTSPMDTSHSIHPTATPTGNGNWRTETLGLGRDARQAAPKETWKEVIENLATIPPTPAPGPNTDHRRAPNPIHVRAGRQFGT